MKIYSTFQDYPYYLYPIPLDVSVCWINHLYDLLYTFLLSIHSRCFAGGLISNAASVNIKLYFGMKINLCLEHISLLYDDVCRNKFMEERKTIFSIFVVYVTDGRFLGRMFFLIKIVSVFNVEPNNFDLSDGKRWNRSGEFLLNSTCNRKKTLRII